MFSYSKLAALAVVFALAGCSAVPIMNVSNSPVSSASGKALSKEQVRGAILRAGSTLGWQMKDEGPDSIVATLELRTHVAVVTIPYSSNTYSIIYRSSTNLKEQGGNISKHYNEWIQNLKRGINAQMTAS